MGPFPHRLPVQPSQDRTTLEEIMLARKIMLDDPHECPAAESSTKRGGVLATPPCLASCVSRLPPEAYTKAVSSRLGKRPRSRLLRRAKPSTDNIIIPNRDGFSRISRDQHYQQQLRPLTGVSPPSTAPQDTFSLIDYFAEGTSRPVTSSYSPPRGVSRSSAVSAATAGLDRDRDYVHILTEKCNTLARRLEDVEGQLLHERADRKKSGRPSTCATRSSTADSACKSDITSREYPASDCDSSAAGVDRTQGNVPNDVKNWFVGERVPTATIPRIFTPNGGCREQSVLLVPQDEATPVATLLEIDGAKTSPEVRIGHTSANAAPRARTPGHHAAAGSVGGGSEGIQNPGSRKGERRVRRRDDEDTRHCELVEQQIAGRFDVVTEGMDKLSNVFSGAAEILANRVRAITTISSAIRMFLQRRRYLRAMVVLKAWRVDHSMPVLQCLRTEILRQKKIEMGLSGVGMRQCRAILSKAFRAWSTVIGSNEQRKYQLTLLAERVKGRQVFDLIKQVFNGLKDQTVGPASFREIARRGRMRMEEAKDRVVAKAEARGEKGLLVTREMVHQDMSRSAIHLMRKKIDSNMTRSVLAHLTEAVRVRKSMELQAGAHFTRWATRRIVKDWKKWAFLKAHGQDRKLMTGYKAGMGLRYNPNKVAAFARRRTLATVFSAWARSAAQLASATRMQRKRLTEVGHAAFSAWKAETKKSKQVKKIAVGMWADFSLKELGVPFRMWYIYADVCKRQRQDHERLLRIHRRARNRRQCHNILRSWKHLAVYGRIEGLYTRSQLMASLAEQKEHTLGLVGKVTELAGGLGDMEELAMEYRAQMIARKRETRERETGMDMQTMALHHAEQEIVRLQSLLNAVAQVAPHASHAILEMAPGFDFEARGLEPYTNVRAEALVHAEEARVREEVAKRLKDQDDNLASCSLTTAEGSMIGAVSIEQSSTEVSGSGSNIGSSNIDSRNSGHFQRRRAEGHEPPSSPIDIPKTLTAVEISPTGAAPNTALSLANPFVETSDAQTQARLPADPVASARAAVAVAALAQGVAPPILPRELARLDRVEWVLQRTSLANVLARFERGPGAGWCSGENVSTGNVSRGSDSGIAMMKPSEEDNVGRSRAREGPREENKGGKGTEDAEVRLGDGRDRRGKGQSRMSPGNTETEIPVEIGSTGDGGRVSASASADAPDDHIDGSETSPMTAEGETVSSTQKQEQQEQRAQRQRRREGLGFSDESLNWGEEEDDSDDSDCHHDEEREEDERVATWLAATFEFLRCGRSSLLPPELRVEWEARPDMGLALLPADDSTRVRDTRAIAGSSAEGEGAVNIARPQTVGGRLNTSASGGGHGATRLTSNVDGDGRRMSSSWKGLFRVGRAAGGRLMTFHDLRLALTAQATPPGIMRKRGTAQDRLERRIVDERLRTEQMTEALRGNDRASVAENLYRPSTALARSWSGGKAGVGEKGGNAL